MPQTLPCSTEVDCERSSRSSGAAPSKITRRKPVKTRSMLLAFWNLFAFKVFAGVAFLGPAQSLKTVIGVQY